MASSKEDIISSLRAIIISSKGGLRLSNIRADYKEAFGVDIPFKSIGYSSLEELFKSNPKDFAIVGNKVQAIVKSSSHHIVALVNRQRDKRRPRSNLSFKQGKNLRKPKKASESMLPLTWRTSYNPTQKFSLQDCTKDVSDYGYKKIPDLFQNTALVKTPQFIQRPALAADKSPEERSIAILPQNKSSEEQKSAKHQSSNLQAANKKKIGNMMHGSFGEAFVFRDFEDLKPSEIQSIQPVKKGLIETTANSKENRKEKLSPPPPSPFGSPPPSPFARSLLNTTKEEILLAKKTTQIHMSDNCKPLVTENETPTDLNLIEDASNYEQKLKQFCIERGIKMPTYSLLIKEASNQAKLYGCELSIGDEFTISTNPIETPSEAAARDLVSRKAYTLLTLNNNLPPTFSDTEFAIKLRTLCSEKNLPDPTFTLVECRPKNEPRYFICKVRIGGYILMSSYPEEARDESSARNSAAKKAYEYISANLKSSPEKVSRNDNVTLSKIFNILKTKEYGVWSNKLQSLYLDSYSEDLMPGWFEMVESSPLFEVNHVEKVGIIIKAKTDVEPPEVPVELSTPPTPPTLATLKVPEIKHWEVFVTNVTTSGDIWCRLIGKSYSEVYDSMMTKLELKPPTENVKYPVVGEIYLINVDESWSRVKLKEVFPEKEEASVYLIDLGVEEVVKFSQLFFLEESFFLVPPQAILLSLNDFDSLGECEELRSLMFTTLLGNSFIAEVVAMSGDVASVVLWDTSTTEDVNINLSLLDEVIRTIKGPTLPSIGSVKEMYVSHVEDNGDVYLQTSRKNSDFVDKVISTKFKNSPELVPANGKIDSKKLYITCSDKNGLYYRVKLSEVLEDNFVLMKFIDIGSEEKVATDGLFDLEQTSLNLATIPSQSVRTIISGVGVLNSKVLTKIRGCILNQCVLVKATQVTATGAPPAVELFIRSQTDGTLSSVVNAIANDEEPPIVSTPTRRKSFVVGLESTLSNNIPAPNIPPVGSLFNIIVTLAAHPNLFIVQPLSTQNKLMELMFQLQDECDSSFIKPLSADEFKIGNLYAVKHDDGYWYRAYAHAVISSSGFSVCLCDFGDVLIVTGEKLMPLPDEFKTFPYQAIRAYLAGITPVNKDWTPLDCVNFREMVVEKQFVSRIIEIKRGSKNPNFITLGLHLIDTTTPEDVYIHKMLIEKNMALELS